MPNFDKAWIAGWDASLTYQSCPYKRRDFMRAWERGRSAGMLSSAEDVRKLRIRLNRQ